MTVAVAIQKKTNKDDNSPDYPCYEILLHLLCLDSEGTMALVYTDDVSFEIAKALLEGNIYDYSFSNVGLTVVVAPALTVKVLSQGLKPGFSSLILWSPAASLSVEGVLPMYFSSTVMSAASGVDFTSTEESTGSPPFELWAAAATGDG